MKCEVCNQDLRISNTKYTSEINSEDVYNEQILVCVNTNCQMYCGVDLTNPTKVAKTRKVKVN